MHSCREQPGTVHNDRLKQVQGPFNEAISIEIVLSARKIVSLKKAESRGVFKLKQSALPFPRGQCGSSRGFCLLLTVFLADPGTIDRQHASVQGKATDSGRCSAADALQRLRTYFDSMSK